MSDKIETKTLNEIDNTEYIPPTQLRREITGQHIESQNIHAIEMFGLTAFIEENMSGFYSEHNAPLHVYLNHPLYIKAQERYLYRTRRA